MTNAAALAKNITWKGSKQTYYTAKWMVDKDLVSDFFKAYAYFRWVDDVIDVTSRSREERKTFIGRQRKLIEKLYLNEQMNDLSLEEEIAVELIQHDRDEEGGLQSFVENMFAIIEFDAHRKDQLISEKELDWYSTSVSKSVTDGLQYFIGNGHPYPITDKRNSAARGAHIAHLLRDMIPDMEDGFINIPQEYLETQGIQPYEVNSEPFRKWVEARVASARKYFREGKKYLDQLDVLRCKIVGHWYCARFEGVLDTIEQDEFLLRRSYGDRRRLSSWMNIGILGVKIAMRHNRRWQI
jgi:phytoene/squalene synthetase